jgi:beta-lactamase superfamily II metal-dependent hydrolase
VVPGGSTKHDQNNQLGSVTHVIIDQNGAMFTGDLETVEACNGLKMPIVKK